MLPILCAAVLMVAPADEMRFRLENGLSVLLISQADAPATVVALGVSAGVYDEPEGRCGLAHLAEHAFWYGATQSFASYKAFEQLTQGAPLGNPFQDANAETMWDLTYYYSTRPNDSIEVALRVFAEKLAGVAVTPELIEAERAKALEEVRYATEFAEKNPAGQKLLLQQYRYPKAGIASHLKSIGVEEVRSFLRRYYRPDRCTLVVRGSFDVAKVRMAVENHFGSIQTVSDVGDNPTEGLLQDIPYQLRARVKLDQGEPNQAAWRVALAILQLRLKEHGRAYVEPLHGAAADLALVPDKPATLAPSLIEETIRKLPETLTEVEVGQAKVAAGNTANMVKLAMAFGGSAGANAKSSVLNWIQRTIDHTRFECLGGQRYLDALQQVRPEDVRATIRAMKIEPNSVRTIRPTSAE